MCVRPDSVRSGRMGKASWLRLRDPAWSVAQVNDLGGEEVAFVGVGDLQTLSPLLMSFNRTSCSSLPPPPPPPVALQRHSHTLDGDSVTDLAAHGTEPRGISSYEQTATRLET
jgi:hypothetical protein